MATFDPSVISQIPDGAPDPVGSMERGYRLRDLIDAEQLDALKTRQAKQEVADTEKTKKILSKSDISTPEGMLKAASALNQGGLTRQAMDLMKEAGTSRQQQMQLDEGKLKLLQMSSDVIGPTALQIKQTLLTQGPAMAAAQYQASVPQIINALPAEMKGKIPPQPPQDPQQFLQMLDSAINNSQQARQIITNQLAQRKQETTEKSEAEKERHDRAMESKGSGRPKAPTGFEWDPDNPDELRPIKGGPKDPNARPWQGREKVFSERIVTSANEAGRAIKNITELPVGASTGILGVGASPGHSIFQATKDVLRNKMSSQEVQDYGTMLAGVRRNLATIETTGLTPSGALTEGFASLELREGDTQLTKLRKLAEMRQIVDAGLEVQLADPAIPDTIKDVMHKVLDTVHEAVPYTQHDVTVLQRAQQQDPKMTLGDLVKKDQLGGGPQKITSDADYEKLPSGTEFIAPDGSHRRKP